MGNIFDLFRSIETKEAPLPVSYLIAGLGNPGKEYENTRHNTGFAALDLLAAGAGITVDRAKFHALVGEGKIGENRALLLKPMTYMNLSGEAIAEAAAFYKIPPDHVIVLCDDINLAPGKLRIRHKGSAGGHNGLKSIISCLGSEEFVRFRIGVGQKPTPEYDLAAWVLGTFPKAEEETMRAAYTKAAEGIKLWLSGNQEAALRYSG